MGSYKVYRGTASGGESTTALASGLTGTTYTDGSAVNGTVTVDSASVTFTVASFMVKTNSWNPNPAYVSQIISGQVQGTFDPSSLDGGGSGPFFVIYNWTTGGVWYSQDDTSGTFEPYGGNNSVTWTQGQASTTFNAYFSDVGFYILEVSCVATVYSQYTGAAIATFTQTGYIGNQSDIDTSGATGHAQKAHGRTAHRLTAHAGGGGGNIPLDPTPVLIYVNNTAATNDDIVGVGDTTPCQVVLPSAMTSDVRVTLSSVSVPGGGAISITPASVVVPAGQTTASFAIGGTSGSVTAKDISIHISGNVTGPDTPVTVFHFDNPKMKVTPAGSYTFSPTGNFGATPYAVQLQASIDLNPPGVSTSAPQITNYQLGIVQDGGSFTETVVASNSRAQWQPSAQKGFMASFPDAVTQTTSITGGSDADSSTEVPPFFHGATAITAHTIDSSRDNPNFNLNLNTSSFVVPIPEAGKTVGVLIRTMVTASISTDFDDWLCLWNKSKMTMAFLAADGWSLNVTNNAKNAYTMQMAVETGLVSDDNPIQPGPTCNQQLQQAVPTIQRGATETFTCPFSTPSIN